MCMRECFTLKLNLNKLKRKIVLFYNVKIIRFEFIFYVFE